jgi:hypothetical protein
MANPQVELAALNIALHPHDADGDRYVALMQAAFRLEKAIRVHGSTHAMIGSLIDIRTDHPEAGLEGDIFKFVQIDMQSEWLDIKKMEPISPEDAKKEVVIPDRLKPNVQKSRFVFFPKNHRMVFVSHFKKTSFSPQMAHRFFSELFGDERLASEFPSVEVTIEQSREVLRSILQNTNLKMLTIVVKRPNPDAPDEDDLKLETVLDQQNAREQVLELKSQKDKSLNPNKHNLKLADLAASNGSVTGEIETEEGKREIKETIKHPLKKSYGYPQNVSFRDWFLDRAQALLRIIKPKSK